MQQRSHSLELVRTRRLIASGEAEALRRLARLSLAEMGAMVEDPEHRIAGVSPSTVLRWERGERTPRGAMAVAYGRALERLKREMAA